MVAGRVAAAGELRPFLLIASALVLTLETVRVLFSVGYHLADHMGWIPGGMVVVATFAAPALTPLWRRVAGRAAIPVLAALLIGARLWLQWSSPVPYWLAAAGTAIGLMLICLLVTAVRPPLFGLAIVAGLALDVSLRAVGGTWDLPWREGAVPWVLTALVTFGLVAGATAAPVGRVDDPRAGRSALQGILLGPLLLLACFYTQSPGFLSSSGRVPLALGVTVALLDACVAGVALAAGTGWLSSRPTSVTEWGARHMIVLAVLLAAVGAFLPVATGASVLVLAVAAQLLSAFAYGVVLREGKAAGAVAIPMAGGMLLFGLLALVYQVGFLVKLPVPGRAVPAVAGALFALARTAGVRQPVAAPRPGFAFAPVVALAVAVPVIVAATTPALSAAAAPAGAVRIMTFNINQAVREGQLDLREVAGLITAAHPDVVVLEEVGRGMAVSGTTDEAEWLRRHVRLPYIWAPAGDNQLGNLVLTRLPVLSSSVLDLGKGSGTQARSAAFVRLDLGGGRDLLVIGAHLQNGTDAAIHRTRAAEYDAILRRWDGRPRTVLLGDLNTYPGWSELGLVTGAGFHTTQNTSSCTMPTSNRNCPDWVFASSDIGLSGVHVTVQRPDHDPVVGIVTLPGS